jgi:hypothetical protein
MLSGVRMWNLEADAAAAPGGDGDDDDESADVVGDVETAAATEEADNDADVCGLRFCTRLDVFALRIGIAAVVVGWAVAVGGDGLLCSGELLLLLLLVLEGSCLIGTGDRGLWALAGEAECVGGE